MSDGRHDIRRDLGPAVGREEREALVVLAERLAHERPTPGAAFRGDLRRRLLRQAALELPSWRPRHLRLVIAAYLASGALLLLAGGVSVAGLGPLAASGKKPVPRQKHAGSDHPASGVSRAPGRVPAG